MRPGVRTAVSLVALAACVLAVGISAASFTDSEQNPQSLSATDFLAPAVSASTIGKSQGGLDGTIRPGGTYYVYASVSDPGNPPSGIASVKANVSTITSGQTATSLTASGGPWAVDGASYNYRSAPLTAGSSLSTEAKAYKLALADAAGNSAESQEYSVNVAANTAFKGSSFATANGSGSEGTPEKGDSVIFTFNKEPDPYSIVSGWDGSGTRSVTVSIANSASNDTLSVSGATISSVALDGDFTASSATFSGSSISRSGSTVTIVLGTVAGSVKAVTEKAKPVWSPSGSVFDLVGNLCSTATVSGANQRQF